MQVMQINIHDSDISSSSIKPHEGSSMSMGNGIPSSNPSSSNQSQPAKTNVSSKLFGSK